MGVPSLYDSCVGGTFIKKVKVSHSLLQGGHVLWKTGKTGKMVKKIPCREKSGNLKFC